MHSVRQLCVLCATCSPIHAAHSQVTHDGWFPGTSSIAETEVIPPAFRGVWASSPAMCSDPDGVERISIFPGGVDYYESGGRLERVTQAGQERSIRIKLSYEGEGTFWERVETWTLSQSGDQLTIADEGERSPFSLVKCS